MAVHYLSTPRLSIDGQAAPNDLIEDILQISVEESLHLPGMFTLVIQNDYFPGRPDDAPWRHESLFGIGKSVEFGFASSTTEATDFSEVKQAYLIKGEITAIETHFTSKGQAPVVIRGYDSSHRLHRGRYNRSFQNYTDTDIVNEIIGEVGITKGTIESSGSPHDYVFQENQTNMEFLRERAARNGFELFVQDGKLYFRKPASGDSLTLKWREDIHSFRVRVTSAEQVNSVEVRGWDYKQKQPIVSTKKTEQVITSTKYGSGSKSSSAFTVKPKMIVVNQPVFSTKEADKIAQALCDELGGEFVHADAVAEGNPEIRVGKVVKLSGMGKYDGSYYVTEAHHLYEGRLYTTEFTVRGLRAGDLLTTLSPQTRLKPGQTLLVGLVTNNNDPDGLGRVRVKFPTLTEKHESNWARVVAPGAGVNRGFDCLPEVNDEVLVAFEHGDIHRPYVIGGVWNGKDATPEKVAESVADGKVRLRTFKTRTGHKLQFVEEDKGSTKKGVYVDTVYGHKLSMNDTDKMINIKTTDGHQVLVDDKNKKILISTSGGHSCEFKDTGSKITMASTGTIEITAPQEIKLKVGANSIVISTTGIAITGSGHKIELGPAGININSTATATLKGMATTVKGDVSVAVSSMSITLG